MPTDVIMPQMGESIFEGTITKWLKKIGDPVQKDEPLFEISTDKVDAEIPSPVAGVLTETAVNPRVGGVVRIPRWGWAVRGFYGRYYQPPPLTTVSGPLLENPGPDVEGLRADPQACRYLLQDLRARPLQAALDLAEVGVGHLGELGHLPQCEIGEPPLGADEATECVHVRP